VEILGSPEADMRCTPGNILLAATILLTIAWPCRAQTGPGARIEENDLSVTYFGDWYANASSANSGGRAALTNMRDARATVTFTGTGITWIGVGDPWSGFARVYLDGTLYTVDTYHDSTIYQRPLFSAKGLPAGSHTLSIEVTHTRDGNANGSWVWIDGFEIENGSGTTGGTTASPGRTEQINPSSIYTGTWFTHESSRHSGGSAALAVDLGSSLTISFNGTGIMWIAYRDEWSGVARVLVDGLFAAMVDTYLSPSQAGTTAYSVSGLPSGSHTLSIEVTGTRNPQSGGSWIWVDAFDVIGDVPK
jgi:hypothetical protein